jgi:penicillin-binding protein 2
VVEHGLSGSGAAGPLARDVLVEAFTRLRPGSPGGLGPRVAEAAPPNPTRTAPRP